MDFIRQPNEGSTTTDDVGTLTDEPEKAATEKESGEISAKPTDNKGNDEIINLSKENIAAIEEETSAIGAYTTSSGNASKALTKDNA